MSPELADFKTFSGLTGFSSGIYPYGRHGVRHRLGMRCHEGA